MSTNIQNAFIVSKSLEEMIPFLRDAREEFRKSDVFQNSLRYAQFSKLADVCIAMLTDETADWTMKSCTAPAMTKARYEDAFRGVLPLERAIDTSRESGILSFSEFCEKPYRWAYHLVEEGARQNKIARTIMQVDNESDYTMHCILFPHPSRENTTIGILCGGATSAYGHEGMSLNELFRKQYGLEDYSYWNHTDGPDDIPYEAWSERGKAWHDAIPSFYASDDGFSFPIISGRSMLPPILDAETANKWFSDSYREARIRKCAVKTISYRLVEQMCKDGKQPSVTDILNADSTAKDMANEHAREYMMVYDRVCELVPETFSEVLAATSGEASKNCAQSM